ncbi:hypothetical protein CERZMDRAFT_97065 [Cercospora zeae-maydis SCOH1-5]|uniref:Uncharacterized protein n=1 Tax=Cercospora zeae-maydis SCOH1-5 TaxID=717836 RepID=A0A6A6FGJ1_9PEZI|nr:hypothetical protein CERZMDRAFT_97065 [Cercospora zeae-maydis SCOH1-5]
MPKTVFERDYGADPDALRMCSDFAITGKSATATTSSIKPVSKERGGSIVSQYSTATATVTLRWPTRKPKNYVPLGRQGR